MAKKQSFGDKVLKRRQERKVMAKLVIAERSRTGTSASEKNSSAGERSSGIEGRQVDHPIRGVAQPVEHCVWDAEVVGSNPAAPTTRIPVLLHTGARSSTG